MADDAHALVTLDEKAGDISSDRAEHDPGDDVDDHWAVPPEGGVGLHAGAATAAGPSQDRRSAGRLIGPWRLRRLTQVNDPSQRRWLPPARAWRPAFAVPSARRAARAPRG